MLARSTIYDLLEEQARKSAAAEAILAPDRPPLTYGGLLSLVQRAAQQLNGAGIGGSDRVAVILPNGPEMAVSFLAASCAGVCAPLNPAYRAEEFDFYLSDLRAKAIVVPCGADSPARAVAGARGIPVIELSPAISSPAGEFTLSPVGASSAARIAEPSDVALVLHTSGTTSRPKIVPLTHGNLVASAEHIRAALNLTPGDRCLNVMPLFHIHGLIGATLSTIAAGGSIVCTPGFQAPRFFEWLDEFRPTWYTAVPTMHQAVLSRADRNREIIARSRLRLIRSSSSALPPKVMSELERAFGVPVIESYGMTEASHQMASNPLPPDPRKPGSVGLPAGPEIGVMDEAGNLLPAGETGEVVIRGPDVTAGYENNPPANEGAFTNGWFRTGDQGYLDADGYLFLTGRLKETINRGGEKISPREIDEVLLDHSAVAQAVAFALPDTKLGEDVGAAVVLHPNASATEIELRAFAAERMTDFKVPRRVVIVKEIPKGPTGKLQRIGLADRLGLGDAASDTETDAKPFEAPRTRTETLLCEMWREILGVPRVGIQDNFFYLGGDSILATQFIARLREATGAELTIVQLFETPTVAEVAGWLDASEPAPARPLVSRIGRRSRSEDVPASFAQRRMWFLDQFEEDKSIRIRPASFLLRGSLNVEALGSAFSEILRRHEVLRTTYYNRDGALVPVISSARPLEATVIDLSGLPESDRLARARQLATEEARRPFDLGRDLMLRVALLRLGKQEHVLLLTMHHIGSDGWSSRVLLRELEMLYDAYTAGTSPALPELPAQYADFAHCQNERLRGPVLDELLSYWKNQLAGPLPGLPVPTDHPRPAVADFRSGTESAVLSGALLEALGAMSRRAGVTLFMSVLATFQTLLHRTSGLDDIIIGTPVSGRRQPECDGMIGLFINTLVVRTDLSGNPTFLELLNRTRRTALDAIRHQELPFEKLVEELAPPRDPSRNPLFEVMLNFNIPNSRSLRLRSVEVSPIELTSPEAEFPITLCAIVDDGRLRLLLVYQHALFSSRRMREFLRQYQHLLEQIVTDPEKPIDSYSLVTPESRALLPDPGAVLEEPPQEPVTATFAAWAERTPDEPAISQGSRTWTYAELAECADILARVLCAAGLERGSVVAVGGPPSFGLIAAMMGVLRSGNVLLPADRNLPAQRLQTILGEAKARALLYAGSEPAAAAWREQIAAGDALLFLQVDPLSGRPGNVDLKNLNPVSFAEPATHNAAYVFFSSGTTGVPKAILGCHKGMSHFLNWQRETFSIGPGDRVAQLTSLSFDVVLMDIFLPLTSGAVLCLPEEDHILGPDEVLPWLERRRITVLHAVPTLAQSWLTSLPSGVSLRSLRWTFFGGEALSDALVRRWRSAFPGSGPVVNFYGPTEMAIVKCFYQVPEDVLPGVQPIGGPLPQSQALVLSKENRLCGIGEEGEIILRSPFGTLGYLNAPEESDRCFIQNPFRAGDRDPLYRTGDRGRYRPDGTLEFLGRLDDQVQIHGVRVEPAEVAATLTRHPAVESCFVAARTREQGEASLMAYVVAEQHETTASELRSYLYKQLPAAMLPSAFVFLDRLPKLPNGKIDRQALPAADRPQPRPERLFQRPRNWTEATLAGIWAEVLGAERVGIYDDFFDLGGHSLLATQVASRIRHAFQRDVPLRSLFEMPTIAELAAELAVTGSPRGSRDALA